MVGHMGMLQNLTPTGRYFYLPTILQYEVMKRCYVQKYFELFLGGLWDFAAVGNVGAILEAEPVDDQLAMLNSKRDDGDITEAVCFAFQLVLLFIIF